MGRDMAGKRIPILWIFSLTSCVSIPDHELAKETSAVACETIAQKALQTGELATGDWPSDTWWENFQDPVLTHLVERALAASPTLQKAEALLKAAEQIANQKKARLFPEIDFDTNTNWQHFSKYGFFRSVAPGMPAVINDINFDLNYKYEFDFWGKNRDIFQAALGQAAAFAAEVKQAQLIITTSIAYAYTELQFFLRKQAILQRQLENRDSIAAIRSKREINAIDTALLRLSADANALDAEASLVETEQLIKLKVHQLKALAGMGQDENFEVRLTPTSSISVALPENISLDLVARRPDLIAQKARVEAAAKLIGAAKTDFYPDVNLMGFIGLESIQWSNLFKVLSYSSSGQPAIHLPIFTAGRIKAQLKEKVAEFNQAVYAYNELILQAAREVADAITSIVLLQKEISARVGSLEAAAEQERLTIRRLMHAIDNRIQFFQAQNNALTAELNLAWVETSKQLANVLLIRSLGGGTIHE